MRNARFTAYQRGEKPGGEEEQIASYRLFRQLFASFDKVGGMWLMA
jgi:hypothetical protein